MSHEDLASRKAALSEAKRALLLKRLSGKGTGSETDLTIVPGGQSGPQPLSYTQQRVWFLQQLFPESKAYNMSEAYRVSGPLDVGALQQALNTVAARHAALRTTFASVDDEPIQLVAEAIDLQIAQTDLSHLTPEARDRELPALIYSEGNSSFDLSNGPFIRLSLFRLDQEKHVLTYTLHHIITDEWSNDIFWRELNAFYKEALGSPAAVPADATIQYSDYAQWQREQVESGTLDRQSSFWEEQLSDELPLLQLPFDRPRPLKQSLRGGLVRSEQPDDLLRELEALSREAGTTMFMTLMAAFQALLYRTSSQEDILVGTPIANRQRPETKHVMGMFINTVVLRADLSGSLSFSQLLDQVRQKTLDAFTNQDYPFDLLVQARHPDRDLSYNPLFQTMFVYHPDGTPRELQDATLESLELDTGVAKFDLTLFAGVANGRLFSELEYSSDVFDETTAQRLLAQWETLLAAIVENPHTPVDSLPLLSATEKKLILETWNDTAVPLPEAQCIHELISARAALNPRAEAVITAQEQLTYGDLEARANQLAHRLIAKGAVPGTPVGLFVERTAELLVGILGILKAGAAYVPLEPSYPAERIAAMLQDSNAPLVVSQSSLQNSLPPVETAVVMIDAAEAGEAKWPTSAPDTAVTVDDLAYIIYTSGSTGTPKGVMVTHRNLFVSTMARHASYDEPVGRYLLLSSFAFDSSVAGIFWTLSSGGALVLPAPGQEKNVQQLARIIALERVTHTLALPSLYRVLLDFAPPDSLASLHVVIVAGEVCPPDLSGRHFALLPHCSLFNEYGPTEATVWCSVYQLSETEEGLSVPIGRPVPNYQLYILDGNQQPTPIGVPGELYVAGPGVTPGYWQNPGLTNEQFPALQLDDRAEISRVYRTGDLVRRRADGEIEFLGRTDNQVKIRGFRIELGEIENMLLKHPAVEEATVTVWDQSAAEPAAGKILTAYVAGASPGSNSQLDPFAIRQFLSEQLPDYMLPGEIVALQALPRTPNGKIDGGRLPRPDRERPDARPFVAPRNETEKKLADLWIELLNIPRISVDDNFFDLGGHSLLGIRLFAQIEAAFGKNLSLNYLFQKPTIAQLAKALQNDESKGTDDGLVAIRPEGNRPPIFFTHASYGAMLWITNLLPLLESDQPVYGFQAVGLQPGTEPDTTVEKLAARYVAAMRLVQPSGPYYLGGFCFGGVVAYEMARLLEQQGENIALLAIIDGYPENVTLHDPPVYDPLRLRVIRDSAPRWIQGYKQFGGSQKLLSKLGLRSGPQEDTTIASGGNVEIEYLANFTAATRDIRRKVLEIHQRAGDDYKPQAYGGQITLFSARYLGVNHALFGPADPRRRWGNLAQGGIVVRPVAGSHTSLLRHPHISDVASQLNETLRAAINRNN